MSNATTVLMLCCGCVVVVVVLCCGWGCANSGQEHDKIIIQDGAELGQTQVKIDDIVLVVVKVVVKAIVEV